MIKICQTDSKSCSNFKCSTTALYLGDGNFHVVLNYWVDGIHSMKPKYNTVPLLVMGIVIIGDFEQLCSLVGTNTLPLILEIFLALVHRPIFNKLFDYHPKINL